MSRIDKYSGVTGGFRARLAAPVILADVGVVKGVTINGSGLAVVGGTVGLIVGVICPDVTFAAGAAIDIMTDGELVEVPTFTAGQQVYAAATGLLDTVNTGKYVGQMVELGRLVVRVRPGAA